MAQFHFAIGQNFPNTMRPVNIHQLCPGGTFFRASSTFRGSVGVCVEINQFLVSLLRVKGNKRVPLIVGVLGSATELKTCQFISYRACQKITPTLPVTADLY